MENNTGIVAAYQKYIRVMVDLLTRKRKVIADFRQRLEQRKIEELRNEIKKL